MNGIRVGRLDRLRDRGLRFVYDSEWLANERSTPISLALPLSSSPFVGDAVANYFDNLLPDSEDIRRRMRDALGADTAQPFDLLAEAGADCVGALQLARGETFPDVRRVSAEPVEEAAIARILREHRPLGMTPSDDDFRISIAGAQWKTGFLWYGGAWHRPIRATPTSHIFKLPIGRIEQYGADLSDSVENEWLCLKIARAVGLQVPNARIEQFEDVRVLVVERFDRKWSPDGTWLMRVPQEDLCQALGLPPGRKYEENGGPGIERVLELLGQSVQPLEDQRAFFKACVLYWALAAIDGHAKNFSIFLEPGGRFKLTPFYDILSAFPLDGPGPWDARRLKMAMSVRGTRGRHRTRERMAPRHWLRTASGSLLAGGIAEAILEECGRELGKVPDGVPLPDGFPAKVSDAVFEGLQRSQGRLLGGP